MGLGRRQKGENLGRVVRGETTARIYYIKSILNKTNIAKKLFADVHILINL